MANQPTEAEGDVIMDTIRSNIEAARKQRHLSTPQLAEAAGVGRSQLYKFMQGRVSSLPTDASIRIAKALNVSITDLIGEDREEFMEAAAIFAKIPPELRGIALDQLSSFIAEEREEVVHATQLFSQVPAGLRGLVLAQIEAVVDQSKKPRKS